MKLMTHAFAAAAGVTCLVAVTLQHSSAEESAERTPGSDALRELIERLESVRAKPALREKLETAFDARSTALRAELRELRESIAGLVEAPDAKTELESLRRRERRIVSRLESVKVALVLIRHEGELPGAEAIERLFREDAVADAERRRRAAAADPAIGKRSAELFSKTIAPALEEICQRCHGEKRQKGKLRLTSRAHLLRGGAHGPAVVPFDADGSLLLRLITHAEEPTMPPRKKLPEELTGAFREWIDAGAAWPEARRKVRSKRF